MINIGDSRLKYVKWKPEMPHKLSSCVWCALNAKCDHGGLRLQEPRAGLSYNSQRDWVVKAFGYAGVQCTKKTHIGRSSGAKTAELKGLDEDQIRRAGRWNGRLLPDQLAP